MQQTLFANSISCRVRESSHGRIQGNACKVSEARTVSGCICSKKKFLGYLICRIDLYRNCWAVKPHKNGVLQQAGSMEIARYRSSIPQPNRPSSRQLRALLWEAPGSRPSLLSPLSSWRFSLPAGLAWHFWRSDRSKQQDSNHISPMLTRHELPPKPTEGLLSPPCEPKRPKV